MFSFTCHALCLYSFSGLCLPFLCIIYLQASKEFEELWGQFKSLERDKSHVDSLLLQKSSRYNYSKNYVITSFCYRAGELEASNREYVRIKMETNEQIALLETAKIDLEESHLEADILSKQRIEALEKSSIDLQAKLVNSKREHELYQANLGRQMVILERCNLDIKADIDGLYKERMSYQQDMDKQVHSLRETNAELQTKLDTASQDHDSYKEQCHEKYALLELESGEQIQALNSTNAELQTRLDTASQNHDSYKEQCHKKYELLELESGGQIQALKSTNAELQTRLDTASQDHDSYKEQCHEKYEILKLVLPFHYIIAKF